ncbi:DUF3040 domain-containing protein [Nonomuraea sp. ZG12]|uniref:DUF3040 domain-containing protein n=1 Tax=Nonomuraea sp. ZG12 TaxID=3452207 RepID=UPI003F8C1077
MGLSREEERALQEIEEQLAFDDPDLDALLTRAQSAQPAQPARFEPRRKFSMGLAAWWVLAVLAYVVFVIGLVMTVTTPEEACRGAQGPCEQPSVTKVAQIM